MSENRRQTPWFDGTLFCENRNRFPAEKLDAYVGQYVAWTLDGTDILASGPDEQTVEEELVAAGIDPSAVVLSFIDPPDEAILG